MAAASHADLVVLDVNLPDMDGFEVCRRLRARPETAQLPVLHLSATFTNSADFALGFEAGADGYLTRPVEAPVLIATVRTLLFARHADLVRRGLDAKLRTMFNLVPAAIAILDESLRYESVNPAYCALTGYSADELVGQPFKSYLGPESSQTELLADAQFPAGHAPRVATFRRKDGSGAEIEWQFAMEGISGVRIWSPPTSRSGCRQCGRARACWRASAPHAAKRNAATASRRSSSQRCRTNCAIP